MTCTELREPPPDPVCACCQRADEVNRVPFVRLDPRIDFWRCDRCGYVWELREEETDG